jgi:hypothetical protein
MDSTDHLREFIDSIPALAWSAALDVFAESFSRRWLDYAGLTEECWSISAHPGDLSGMREVLDRSISKIVCAPGMLCV